MALGFVTVVIYLGNPPFVLLPPHLTFHRPPLPLRVTTAGLMKLNRKEEEKQLLKMFKQIDC